MFNSFKKWVKNEEVQRQAPPPGMQTMKTDLQRKFAKGVQYNLKIVIRGDRNTGKTCLWHRLQGQKFVEEYLPTAEIKVASIHWNYKATDDIVKVDVWDIVDQGKNKNQSHGLKMENENDTNKDTPETPVLDASFLDVYKGAHAVIMLFDITKKWTFSYVERELPKVPSHLPVLVLANFRDMGDHRVIIADEVEALLKFMDRPPGSPSVMFSECSLKNGFGLRFVHKFFNMPFLLVQRESLLKQLETNHLDLESCVEELASEDHGYDQFLQMLADRKQGKPVQSPPKPPQNSGPPTLPEPVATQQRAQRPSPPSTLNTSQEKQDKSSTPKSATPDKGQLFSPAQMEDQKPSPKAPEPEKKGFMSRFFRRSSTPEVPQQAAPAVSEPSVPRESRVTNVEEFVPEEGAVDDFLNEIPDPAERSATYYDMSSDDEENNGNPMVAGFQEDLDSDDQEPSYKVATYSSSDSDEFSKAVLSPRKPSPPRQRALTPEEPVKRVTLPELDSVSSEDEPPPHEIIQDDDLPSDDDSYSKSSEKFNKMIADSVMRNNDERGDLGKPGKEETMAEKAEETEDSDEDLKENTMVSNTFDDVSSTDEPTVPTPVVSKHPIAIVTPLQATERRLSSSGEDDLAAEKGNKPAGLNLELDAAALDFLEQRLDSLSSKQSSMDHDDTGVSKGHRSSKKSSSRTKSIDDQDTEKKSSHRRHKHKKHRSKEKDGDERSKGESSRSHRSKDEKERKKKKKSSKSSRAPELTEEEAANKDLEAFLGGDNYEAF